MDYPYNGDALTVWFHLRTQPPAAPRLLAATTPPSLDKYLRFASPVDCKEEYATHLLELNPAFTCSSS